MTCTVIKDDDGKVFGIACSRGPRSYPKCPHCRAAPGKLLCDGCDKPLCAQCSVGPTSKLDFCPSCFAPAWRYWLKHYDLTNGNPALASKTERRIAFRAWVKANKKQFSEMVAPRTAASKEDVPDNR